MALKRPDTAEAKRLHCLRATGARRSKEQGCGMEAKWHGFGMFTRKHKGCPVGSLFSSGSAVALYEAGGIEVLDPIIPHY